MEFFFDPCPLDPPEVAKKPTLHVIQGDAPEDGQEMVGFRDRSIAFLEDELERAEHLDTPDGRRIRSYCRGRLAVVRLLRACR